MPIDKILNHNLWKNVFRAIILFVVEGEGQVYNVCDQKFHEFEIRKQNPDCYVMRKNLTEIAEQGKLVGDDARLFVDGQEVAVVYFRCGYVILFQTTPVRMAYFYLLPGFYQPRSGWV